MTFSLTAFTGAAGSGKTTAALVAIKTIHAARVSFAAPIYHGLSVLTGVPVSYLQNRKHKEKNLPGLNCTVRRALQTLGTEWGRELIDKDIWIKQTAAHIQAARVLDIPVVIDDLRFRNEVSFLKKQNCHIVGIVREGIKINDSHASENQIEAAYCDHIIMNAGSLADFRAEVSLHLLEKT